MAPSPAPKGHSNQHLKRERELRGWSQKDVAERIGADDYYLSRWERGAANPSPYYRQKLSVLFGKSPAELGLLVARRADASASKRRVSDRQVRREQIIDPAIPPPISARPEGLVGRNELLERLSQRLQAGDDLVLTALNGIPGVGKTAVALALAHAPGLLEHFRDGVLWAGVGLQENVPEILSHWGNLLGISAAQAAKLTTPEAWARALHAAIGARQFLLILDDIWRIEDALAFKIGGPGCAYLVTTRFPQIALQFAATGAVTVEELDAESSLLLLSQLAPEAMESEPQAVHELLDLIGGLPLTLTIVGRYLHIQAHSGQPRRIRAAIERLRDAEARLHLSAAQALQERSPTLPASNLISLRAVLEVGYQQLDELTRKALSALTVFPPKPGNFSEAAALAVCEVAPEVLDTLWDAGLLETRGEGRYALHQSIADFARLHFSDQQAYARLCRYYATYAVAQRQNYPQLELELSNLFVALEIATTRGYDHDLVRMATALARLLHARGLFAQAQTYLQKAELAARKTHDTGNLITILFYLGLIGSKQGTFQQAREYSEEGLALARQSGDRERICDLLQSLGRALSYLGDYQLTITYLRESLEIARELRDEERISALLVSVAAATEEQGNYQEAEAYLHEGIAIAHKLGSYEHLCDLQINLGSTLLRQGKNEGAEEAMLEALKWARQVGYREAVSLVLGNLGVLAYEGGNLALGKIYTLESLEIARENGSLGSISLKLGNLGEIALLEGDLASAEGYLREAVELSRQLSADWFIMVNVYLWGEFQLQSQHYVEARAAFEEVLALTTASLQEYQALGLYGLARIAVAQGGSAEARQLGQQALTILASLGHRKRDEIESWLGQLTGETRKQVDHPDPAGLDGPQSSE